MYDQQGIEIHRIALHRGAAHLEFLRYHWLLASATARTARLAWTDTSTGQQVATTRAPRGAGPIASMVQDQSTGVLWAAHSGAAGVVSLWAPAQNAALARLAAHRGGVCMPRWLGEACCVFADASLSLSLP